MQAAADRPEKFTTVRRVINIKVVWNASASFRSS